MSRCSISDIDCVRKCVHFAKRAKIVRTHWLHRTFHLGIYTRFHRRSYVYLRILVEYGQTIKCWDLGRTARFSVLWWKNNNTIDTKYVFNKHTHKRTSTISASQKSKVTESGIWCIINSYICRWSACRSYTVNRRASFCVFICFWFFFLVSKSGADCVSTFAICNVNKQSSVGHRKTALEFLPIECSLQYWGNQNTRWRHNKFDKCVRSIWNV